MAYSPAPSRAVARTRLVLGVAASRPPFSANGAIGVLALERVQLDQVTIGISNLDAGRSVGLPLGLGNASLTHPLAGGPDLVTAREMEPEVVGAGKASGRCALAEREE